MHYGMPTMGDSPFWDLEEKAKSTFEQLLDGASELDGLVDRPCFCRKGCSGRHLS
jgi:hypothetical protein